MQVKYDSRTGRDNTGTPLSLGVSTRQPPSAWYRLVHSGVGPLLMMGALSLVLLSLSRLLLVIWQYDQVPSGGLGLVFLQGIRVDFASICGLFALPLLLLGALNILPWQRLPSVVLFLLKLYGAAAIAFLVMNEAATPGFILEYGVRPNHIYVKYLIYPREVFLTLWGGHKLELFLSCAVTVLSFILSWRFASWCFKDYRTVKWSGALLCLLLTICIVPLGIRSTLGHRPLNPSMVSFSSNALANSLPVNSSYNAVYALLHLDEYELSDSMIYQLAPENEVLAAAKELSARVEPASFDPKCPINQQVVPFYGIYAGAEYAPSQPQHSGQIGGDNDASGEEVQVNLPAQVPSGLPAAAADKARILAAHAGRQPYNVVIILEESLGNNFVGSQGGFPVTPYLEKLREKGWWFNHMFAAGHRSIRGIEAVTASMPPSPLDSIVQLPPTASQYASIFNIFHQAGYKTSFIYGGESHFDNMRTYFLENGMEQVIEQKDYKNPSFVASWGVSDEDLFNKANEMFKEHTGKGERFCSVIFSSSFHDPFDIPPGKVSLDGLKTDQPERLLAAKYADYALGKFLEQAEKENYYHDTVFLVVADHESQVRGAGKFPLNDFTIPAVIIAPNVLPHEDNRIVSQIDLGLTVMSLAGLSGEVPNVGQNLTQPQIKERAMVQFNNIFGLLEQNSFIQLAPQSQPYWFDVRLSDQELTASQQHDEALLQRAIRLSNLGPLIYNREYKSINCVKLSLNKEEVQAAATETKVRTSSDAPVAASLQP